MRRSGCLWEGQSPDLPIIQTICLTQSVPDVSHYLSYNKIPKIILKLGKNKKKNNEGGIGRIGQMGQINHKLFWPITSKKYFLFWGISPVPPVPICPMYKFYASQKIDIQEHLQILPRTAFSLLHAYKLYKQYAKNSMPRTGGTCQLSGNLHSKYPRIWLQEKGQTMGKPVGTFTTCLHKKG